MSEAKPESPTTTLTDKQREQLLGVGSLFTTLAADPKYRPRVLGLMKEADPSLAIPELDLASDLDQKVAIRFETQDKKMQELTAKNEALERQISRRIWAEQHGLSEDEVVEIEGLAKDRGITKADTAMEFWKQSQQLGVPRATPRAKEAEDYEQKIRKLGARNVIGLKAAVQERAGQVLRELRGGQRTG